ncbi:AAA family ATPase [Neisseria shayeganii]|uniref:MoxR family ATPase n=1 Tax=Neisseria shayeganii TaxID=607712 RepID=A0A7D7N518_9NEIS|nr:MoxR family ATPase [Neisseria shayeganii]QMT39703.1 MoxR family ATPase [Neisseria shayeganii]
MTDINLSRPAQAPASPAMQQGVRAVQVLRQRLNDVLIGQARVVDEVLTVFLAGGHVLLEGVPGVGKTLLVRSLAQTFAGEFRRIQFTPDLMPSDVTGHYRYDAHNNRFELRQGPVFTHLLLADEINRAPAKTQSALLEVMQERSVTLDGHTHPLPRPFMVLATQNPIEQEGTYPLPEAQLDRFMFKVLIGYPNPQDEARMVSAVINSQGNDILKDNRPRHVFQPGQIEQLQKLVTQVAVDPQIIDYAVRLVTATRDWPALSVGAGPRAGIALISCARAYALIADRDYVTPDDIKAIWLPAMRHRVRLSTQMEMEGIEVEQVLNELAASVPAPRL